MAVPRIEAAVTVDGSLTEEAWKHAAVLAGFSQFSPVDGRAADDSTEVLVWYSSTAIHFGVRAFEAHGAVHATLANRDKIASDDFVQILLDTFDDHRQAYVFGVNPLGVQADGMLNEGNQSRTAGFGGAAAVRDTVDLSADFMYESRGHVTPFGYEVEIRVPFRALRYGAGKSLTFGIQVVRQVQHSGFQDTWTPTKRAAASFLGQSGELVGLSELSRGLVFDVNPELTAVQNGGPRSAPAAGWSYNSPHAQLGGNVRYSLTNNLTLNATVKPDFSQVEADVQQVVYDPRNALFYPEKRPFFLDGLEQFDTPNRLVYTRRIVQPTAAVKLTGKVAGTNIALLSALDDPSTSPTGNRPLFDIVRLRRDVGRSNTIGMVFTDREDGSLYNRVGEFDGRVVFGGVYSARAQLGMSATKNLNDRAPLFEGVFQRDGRTFGLRWSISGTHPDFVAASGFVSRPGLVNLSLDQRLTFYGKEGAFLESWTTGVGPSTNWNYKRFWAGKGGNDPKLHFNNQLKLHGGWTVSPSVFFESFKYDPTLYSNFRLAVPNGRGGVDTVPYVGGQRIPNLDIVIGFSTPQWKHFDLAVQTITGYDENFYEWSSARIALINATVNWRPTEKLRINGLYSHQEFIRRTDNSEVAIRRIPRLKVEYQLSRPIFIRLVGQYDSQFQDALRDDSRTGLPILTYDPKTRTVVQSKRFSANALRGDALFSYQPTPGTVLFLGYGSSLIEEDAFAFRELQRKSDGIFVKLSYVFSSGRR
ncbi:MAG: carbohydrate binding family 9 domain-containing protein [Gemmatimonadota bacterium]|nr:carbohydrate binding family 9 domain-containing protein [Gemmatimonadota bacterium]